MDVRVTCAYQFLLELRASADASGVPYLQEPVNGDLGDLVEETFVGGVLADRLPPDPDSLLCEIEPRWSAEPHVESLEVRLAARAGSREMRFARSFVSGRWSRRAVARGAELRAQGTVPPEGPLFQALLASRHAASRPVAVPPLAAPPFAEASLESCGVRGLGAGELDPERPVLVCGRLAAQVVRLAEEAGAVETGGAVLGRLVRLPEPLAGTATRVVTLLAAAVTDSRHEGSVGKVSFSPEALAEAAALAEMRGLGETVLTAFHSHGWGQGCGQCNRNPRCPLPPCTRLSLEDYQLVETLFPSKATVLPVAGRKLGAPGESPVLEIHAWQSGAMRPISWRSYDD